MKKLKSIIEDPDTKGGKIFDICIQVLILASLVSFCIGTLPDLSESTIRLLKYFEIFTIIVFTIEYILRIIVADHKLKYIFSFYGIIDLLSILPFYLSLGVDLRSLKLVRIFRIFRLLKFSSHSKAIKRFHVALKLAGGDLIVFYMAAVILFILSGVGIYLFENPAQPELFTSVFSSMWWAVITLTTVGYGDIYPITAGGQIFTFFILMLGLGIVAIPSGILASSLSKARDMEHADKEKS